MTDIRRDIAALQRDNEPSKQHGQPRPRRMSYKRREERIEQLNELLMYLGTNPREDVVREQLALIERELSIAASRRATFEAPKHYTPKQREALFNKTYETARLKRQHDALKYLLS